MRQGTPLAACAIQVQNGIDYFSHVGCSWVSTWLGGRDERFEDGPFLLGQITGVAESIHISTSSIFPLFLLLYYITFHTASETLGFDLNAGGAFLARQVEDKTAKF